MRVEYAHDASQMRFMRRAFRNPYECSTRILTRGPSADACLRWRPVFEDIDPAEWQNA